MSANFTPIQGGYKDVSNFRYWCQTVLPTVYDDSLSYYELLNKVVNYLNDVINNTNTMGENIDGLYGAYEKLQGYVNSYFDNLNVQAEIDSKLEGMVADGTLALGDVLNVKSLGAKGDGETDDTEVIQHAVNLANTTGKTVYLPVGTYIITKPIAVYGETKIIGESIIKTTIKKTTAAGLSVSATYEGVTEVLDKNSVFTLVYPNDSNVSCTFISNLQITASQKNQYAIYAPHISYCCFNNIRVHNTDCFGLFGGWINKISDIHVYTAGSHSVYIMRGTAYVIERVTSNQGSLVCNGCHAVTIRECSMDNGGPSYFMMGSEVCMYGCTCETYNQVFNISDSVVNVYGGDFEGHSSEGVSFSGFVTANKGSKLYIRGGYIHFDDYYGLGYPANAVFSVTASEVVIDAIIKDNFTLKHWGSNGYYLAYNGNIYTDKQDIENVQHIKTKLDVGKHLLASVPIAYRKHKIIKLFGKAYSDYDTVAFIDVNVCAVHNNTLTVGMRDNTVIASYDQPEIAKYTITCEFNADTNCVDIYVDTIITNNFDLLLKYR